MEPESQSVDGPAKKKRLPIYLDFGRFRMDLEQTRTSYRFRCFLLVASASSIDFSLEI